MGATGPTFTEHSHKNLPLSVVIEVLEAEQEAANGRRGGGGGAAATSKSRTCALL